MSAIIRAQGTNSCSATQRTRNWEAVIGHVYNTRDGADDPARSRSALGARWAAPGSPPVGD
ncbi:hypothetical protein GCM10010266_67020 [Streptomyces griseomycini]|nr:hypothetical protein GCM10010266_67020 [Streptomyces griseomycini]